MYLKFLHLLLAVVILPLSAFAATTAVTKTIDGTTYKVVDGGVSVTYTTQSKLIIPDSVVINDSTYAVVGIDTEAFQKNKTLYEVVVPPTVIYINPQAFESSNVTKVTLSEGLEYIWAYAFRDCKFLTELTIPSTVKRLNYNTFASSALTKVTFKGGIEELPEYAFYECVGLEEVILPNTLRKIGEYTFSGCTKLMNIDIPETVLEIGKYAFKGCSKLASIDLPPLLSVVNISTFENCINLQNVNFPANLSAINGSAFYGCRNLTSISLPEKLQGIYSEAFYGCENLREVYMPHTINKIVYGSNDTISNVFKACKNLTKVHVRSQQPTSFGAYLFVPKNKPDTVKYELYVPVGTKELYKKVDTYSRFDIIEEEVIGLSMEAKQRLIAGTTEPLEVRPVPSVFPLSSISWESSNTAAATVDTYGNVTAHNPGTTVITATTKAEGETITAHCTVEVIAAPTASFVVQPTTLGAGSTAALPIEMVNENDIVAFQCDIYLPQGMGFAKDDDGEYDFRYAGREGRSHVIESRMQPDGAMRVVGYSTSNAAYKDKQGTLFYVPLTLPSMMGNYTIRIANILVTEKSLDETPLFDVVSDLYVGASMVGDANSDGRITISDAAVTSAYILGDVVDGFSFTNADVIADGTITLADVSEIVNRVLGAQNVAPKRVMSRAHGVEFPTREGDLLYMEDFDIAPGEEKEVSVCFSNIDPFNSFFVEIILPEGLYFVDEDGEYFIDLNSSRKTRSHTTACKLQEDGRLRALAYSTQNALFKGNDGELFTFYIKADDDFDNTKTCKIRLENNYISNRPEGGNFTDYDINDCEALVNKSTSSVANVNSTEWNIYVTVGNVLNIEAPQSDVVSIVSIDGIARSVSVESGHNTISGLAPGFYIVKGKKIVIR